MNKPMLLAAAMLCACSSGSTLTTANGEEAATTALKPMYVNNVLGRSVLFSGRSEAVLGVAGRTAEQTTLDMVDRHAAAIGIRDAARELRATRVNHDELGMTHVRMQQVVNEVPVRGAELLAHYDVDGALVNLDVGYVPSLDGLDTTAQVDARDAAQVAALELQKKYPALDVGAVAASAKPELVVWARKGTIALAWELTLRVNLAGAAIRRVYYVDAKSAAIVHTYDNLQTVAGSGVGIMGDTKVLQVQGGSGGFQLVDLTRTPQGITTNTADSAENEPGNLVTSTSATAWDHGGVGSGAAVDAHFYAGVVYDYYKSAHQRSGIDGQDGAIVSTVHFGSQYDNAFWDGTQMVYGDGDGQEFRSFPAGLDVIGHELTHGVTQFTSNLDYQDQSGALNESMSDIFGAFVEHFHAPDPVKNWTMGENIALGAEGMRDMIHPANGQQPAHMSELVQTSEDSGGVHTNSGVPNNAMFLMTMGGTNDTSQVKVPDGIGWENSAKVWYRANTQYLRNTSGFAEAASATISAAKDLSFSQHDQDVIACAWIATGVTQGTCNVHANPIPPPDAGAPGADAGKNPPHADAGAPTNGGGDGPSSNGDNGDNGDTNGGLSSGDTGTPKKKAKAAPDLAADSGAGCSAAPGAPDANGMGVLVLLGAAIVVARARGKKRKIAA